MGIILLIFDEICHRRGSFRCRDPRCINAYCKYAFLVHLFLMITHSISYAFAVLIGSVFSIITAVIMSMTRPFSLFGNSTLAIILFSLPCFIGFAATTYVSNIFHRFIRKKLPRNSSRTNETHVDGISFEYSSVFHVSLAVQPLHMYRISSIVLFEKSCREIPLERMKHMSTALVLNSNKIYPLSYRTVA